ncbi:MAG: FMN-binding protein [Actinomycetota bacterium]
MKRALLIVGGTVGGIGAVLSITPPQIGLAHGGVSTLASGSTSPIAHDSASQARSTAIPQTSTPTTAPASSTPTQSTVPATKKSSSPDASPAATSPAASARSSVSSQQDVQSESQQVTKKTAVSSPSASTSTATETPTSVATGVSGSFTGATYDATEGNYRLWGRVTVTVTLKDGVISNINAVQSPSSRSWNAFNYITPAVLTQKLTPTAVMAISSDSLVSQIRGYTGASYTCLAYWESLQSALTKAGF